MAGAIGNENWAWVLSHAVVWGLVLARVLGLCFTAPALAVPEADWRFRLGLAFVLSLIVIPVVEPAIAIPTSWSNMVQADLLEVLTGAMIGWSAALILAGARLGGDIVAAQAGLSTAMLIDPETGEEVTPLGRFYGWIALTAFLALNGPLVLVGAVVESYQSVPAGGLLISTETANRAFGQLGHALELALRVAAPAALALALAGIVLGLLSRAAPSLPFVALALPLRCLLGTALVLLSLAPLVATLSSAWWTFPWAH
jgi:flagellar biosynthesis protein FliR